MLELKTGIQTTIIDLIKEVTRIAYAFLKIDLLNKCNWNIKFGSYAL